MSTASTTGDEITVLTSEAGAITELRPVGTRSVIRVGDRIRVKPRRTRGRDGYVAHVRAIVDEPGFGLCLEVFDPKGGLHTFPLDRFERIHQTKGGQPL